MSNRGYILMSRQLLKHPRFKPRGPFSQFEAWYWLIESAAYHYFGTLGSAMSARNMSQ